MVNRSILFSFALKFATTESSIFTVPGVLNVIFKNLAQLYNSLSPFVAFLGEWQQDARPAMPLADPSVGSFLSVNDPLNASSIFLQGGPKAFALV